VNVDESLIEQMRSEFHAGLVAGGTLTVNSQGVASIADGNNRLSVAVGYEIATALQVETEAERAAGQTLGGSFEVATANYLRATFPAFRMLRPGQWEVTKIGNARRSAISGFEPYQHLADLAEAIERDPTLISVLGNAYAISPDIVVTRLPEPDTFINAGDFLVDDKTALMTAIRSDMQGLPILHAVVSCKWTLRSDRAQNARSEALNLIRNRKGRLPHIVVVTAEPTPSRLSSLALGTGDVDCVYHVALPELVGAMERHGNDDNIESLRTMIDGRRLKDISDLPLDLTI
jgi:hypothetical protein